MFAPRTLPDSLRPAHERFCEQAERVQAAREVVLSCLPVGRVERAPVPAGLEALRSELTSLRGDLGDWRVGEVEREWTDCRAAVEEALEGIPRAVDVARTTGELEELLGAVSDVVEPLGDSFWAAERRWRSLRRRRRRNAR